jgi:hypothetical protein
MLSRPTPLEFGKVRIVVDVVAVAEKKERGLVKLDVAAFRLWTRSTPYLFTP